MNGNGELFINHHEPGHYRASNHRLDACKVNLQTGAFEYKYFKRVGYIITNGTANLVYKFRTCGRLLSSKKIIDNRQWNGIMNCTDGIPRLLHPLTIAETKLTNRWS